MIQWMNEMTIWLGPMALTWSIRLFVLVGLGAIAAGLASASVRHDLWLAVTVAACLLQCPHWLPAWSVLAAVDVPTESAIAQLDITVDLADAAFRLLVPGASVDS